MSGDRIILGEDVEGSAARLVRTAARLASVDLGDHALIGGLAVMCRLAAVHRATQDVDTVTETTSPTTVEVLTSTIGEQDPSNPNRVVVDGIKIDVIETAMFDADDLDGISLDDQLFVVSHRWALENSTEIEIVAGRETASIRVATPSALVAMKSGAVATGRPREPHKLASDLYDLYRVTLEYDRSGVIGDSLVSAPFGLGRLVANALREGVLNEVERAVRRLLDGGPEMGALTANDLLDVIGPLVDRLER